MVQNATSTLLSPELLARLEKMELVSRKVFRGRMKGERRSPRKGQSVEFADFRNYVPGDDLRFVDWNTYARLEKLFLKMFLEEEDLHFYALIDTSGSMDFGSPTKLKFAVQLAAALGFIGLVRGDRVKIETIGQSARDGAPAFRGRRSLWRMLDHLEEIAGGKGDRSNLCEAPGGPFRQIGPVPFSAPSSFSLAEGVKSFCLRNSGKGIVVLISDLMDKSGYESALRYSGLAADGRVRDPRAVARGVRARRAGRLAAGRLRGRRRGRGDGDGPADEALQADAGRVRRFRPRVLRPPRHDVSAGPQRNVDRAAFDGLFSDAGLGAVGRERTVILDECG